MNLQTMLWREQKAEWPREGRHILAQFDDVGVVVYQAFRPEIGHFAARHGYLGDGFSVSRMSWIKPNFLWMMYRCGWATKENQETVLAITLSREAFENILDRAVPSSYAAELYTTEAEWQAAVSASAVRLQWDPDHGPKGNPLVRRAVQLGLRGDVLRSYAREWIRHIEDITPFVREQHEHILAGSLDRLQTPVERVYLPGATAARQVGVQTGTAS